MIWSIITDIFNMTPGKKQVVRYGLLGGHLVVPEVPIHSHLESVLLKRHFDVILNFFVHVKINRY